VAESEVKSTPKAPAEIVVSVGREEGGKGRKKEEGGRRKEEKE